MKTVGPLLALIGLLLLYHSEALAPPQKSTCCYTVAKKGILIINVRNIIKTNSTCKLEAYIVTAVDGSKTCISPWSPWIKRHRSTLENLLGHGLE